MALPYHQRSDGHVRRPTDEYKFQEMCVDVYSDYYKNQARHFGTRGQKQHGIDILVTDWTHRGGGPFSKVWIQCKHSAKNKLNKDEVLEDIQAAANLARTDTNYSGAYLFILATSAANSAAVHAAVETYAPPTPLPFKIEVHTWDTLCAMVRNSNWLWERYTTLPREDVSESHLVLATLLESELEYALRENRFDDARRIVLRRITPREAVLGIGERRLPYDIWERRPVLRALLLRLYEQAVDSRAALDIRRYEFGLSGMKDASLCLAYLEAARITHELYVPDPNSFFTARPDPFCTILDSLFPQIVELYGSPDDLGCLAVLLVLEATSPLAHRGALQMMCDLVMRFNGTELEAQARVAYGVVRFYYVMRYGWVDPVRHYAAGDGLKHGRKLRLPDVLIDAHFDEQQQIGSIGGQDPLAAPHRWFSSPVSGLKFAVGLDFDDLPKLSKQGSFYKELSRKDDIFRSPYQSTTDTLSRHRVVTAETLYSLSLRDEDFVWRRDYIVQATEYTLARFLGYRSILRAYQQRTGGTNNSCTRQLDVIESLVGSCAVDGKVRIEPGRLWITPLYDAPPSRLVGSDCWQLGTPHPFTLRSSDLKAVQEEARFWPPDDTSYMVLEKFYTTRDHELSLSTLLALHTRSPVLDYEGPERSITRTNMGIGCEYPGAQQPVFGLR